MNALGGELGVYVYNENMRNGKSFVAGPLTAWNFLCVPQQSTKKDQAMQFLNWLFENRDNHDLFELGIEGTDWEAVGDDEYRKLDGSTYNFPGYEMTWNPNFIRTNADLPDDAKAIAKYGNDPDTYITSAIAGFTFDNTAPPNCRPLTLQFPLSKPSTSPRSCWALLRTPPPHRLWWMSTTRKPRLLVLRPYARLSRISCKPSWTTATLNHLSFFF